MLAPLIKWPGGKRRIAELVSAQLSAGPGMYYEPFAGSLAVLVYRRQSEIRQTAVASDVNERLISMYRAVRDAHTAVIAELRKLPRLASRASYDEIRQQFNEAPREDRSPKQAARFLWLNRACFNGLYRESADGSFNAPIGVDGGIVPIPAPAKIEAFALLLGGVKLLIRSWDQVFLESLTERDTIYLDPPYLPRIDESFTGYTGAGFGLEEHKGLCRAAGECRARVVLSGSDTAETNRIATEAGLVLAARLKLAHTIGASSDSKQLVGEVLYTNRAPRLA